MDHSECGINLVKGHSRRKEINIIERWLSFIENRYN